MADQEQQHRTSADAEDPVASTPLAIVGVCVGATALPSLIQLFSDLEMASDAAYVVAVRQREGLDVATVVEALRRASVLPVVIAADGKRLVAGHVYVGAPNDLVTIEDGHLRTRPADEPVGHRGGFDSLLISLASHAHERTIAVLLTGHGSDGTAGIVATKKFGGLSIAEAAGHESAPQGGADPSAVADLYLPVDRIPVEITRYIQNLQPILTEEQREEDSGELEAKVTQIATILRNVTSHDFHGYKRGTFVRRIKRRMLVLQIEGGVDSYVERLRSDREEVQLLFQDLLIGVTQFFRDPAEFDTLERELPRLFENRTADDHFRVWVLGCATGEEAYSLAILLREHIAQLDHPPEIQIFATDLDARALSIARAGRYADTIANHVRPDRLDRWFVREGDTYCVSKELREMCIFSPHNIVKDAPFSRIDILSCRNLLIYLNTDLQYRVIPIFHFSLRSGGILFLGSSENVTRHQKLFAPIDRKSRIFRRLETATRIIPDFPLTPRSRGGGPTPAQLTPSQFEGRLSPSVGRQAEAVAERYAPAHVVVDSQGDVLHFSGRTGRYLEPSPGAATLSLPALVHRDLRLDMRSALHRAIAEGRRVEVPRLTIRQEDRASGVNLIVEPLSAGDVTSLVVVFQDLGPISDAAADADRLTSDEHVQRLDAELRVTRDRLQATIEELESTNEELKSSNEEYQSINEELQSANEEMETSKEELQSVNEELQTVNGELAHRVHELGRTNSDLKNLLESTQIATVFLDNDLRVRNFTPAATDIFHLLETDVGRPLDHVVSRVEYPDLQEDVRRVLKTLAPVDREVIDPSSNRHFVARVLPYRSVDNFINGAVVTFTDFTLLYQAQAALRNSEERLSAFVTASSNAIYRMSPDWTEMYVLDGRGFIQNTPGRSDRWMETYILPDDQASMRSAIDAAIASKTMFQLEHRIRTADGRVGWTHSRAVPILDKEGSIVEWFGAAIDTTELRESEERFRQFANASSGALWIRDAETLEMEYVSPAVETIYGVAPGAFMDGVQGWASLIVPEDREAALQHLQDAKRGESVVHEFRVQRGDDQSFRWIRNTDFPLHNDQGRVQRIGGIAEDVTEAKLAVEHQGVLLAELQHRVRNIMAVLRSIVVRTTESGGSVQDYRELLTGRLMTLARVQALLTRAPNAGVPIGTIVEEELSAQAAHAGQFDIAGAAVLLSPKAAETMTLAVHELTTNALKHGALATSEGHVRVRWAVVDRRGTPWLTFDWSERGAPTPPAASGPRRQGFGSELIEGRIPYELRGRGEVTITPGGAQCRLEFPLKDGASILETDAPKRATVFGGVIDMTGEADLSGQRILVVEDDYYLATDTARALKGAGATVVGPYSNEADAREGIVEAPLTGAVLDINLAGAPSFDLARELKADGTPFLFVTGYDQEVIPDELDDIVRLQKPVAFRSIVAALGSVLATKP